MKQYIEIPERWEELSSKQFKYLLKAVFLMIANTGITSEDILRDFSDYLLGRKKYIHPMRKEKYLILIHETAKKLCWIFTIVDEMLQFNFETTKNLLPRLEKLSGPQSHGSDFRFGEFRMAVEYYNRFTQNHKKQDLDALVGILYRKPNKKKIDEKFDGNYRRPFNKHLIGKYASRVKSFPEYIKWGVYVWFGYFCKYMMEGTFIIEGNEVCFAPVFKRESSDPDEKKENSIGMAAVLFTLADAGTFGNAKETDETELYKVLLKLLHDNNILEEIKKNDPGKTSA